MDGADRPANKDAGIFDLLEDEEAQGTAPFLECDDWPAPCSTREQKSPAINLYLALHCPRCGQLANLDPKFRLRPCLLDYGEPHRFLLSGRHHEFEH